MSDPVCDLCLQLRGRNAYRLAGLDVCARCHCGELADARAAWGLTLDANHRMVTFRSGDSSVEKYVSDVTVGLSHPAPLSVRFSQQVRMHWLLKALSFGGPDDPEVGDPLFDDHVEIRVDRGAVLQWLQDEGLQTAIMNVVSDGASGFVQIDRDGVAVRRVHGLVPVDPGPVQAEVVAIAVQLERFRRGMEGGG